MDKTFKMVGKTIQKNKIWFKPLKRIRNGEYQHIFWLGINGFVIVNRKDKEVLVVDPWPSHCSYWINQLPKPANRFVDARLLDNDAKKGKKRLEELATFLRNAVSEGYSLSGILLSHMHFDHSDDVVYLLELLVAGWGPYTNHKDLHFEVSGPPVPTDKLPTICCDFDSMVYLKTRYFRVDKNSMSLPSDYWKGKATQKKQLSNLKPFQLLPTWQTLKDHYVNTAAAWKEIVDANGKRMYYDDTYNANHRPALKAGAAAKLFNLGNFTIKPYVWDHMRTGLGSKSKNALPGQQAGHLQRISAFLFWRRGVKGAKRTFIVGSAGEMSKRYTSALVANPGTIKTDVLIHAAAGKQLSIFDYKTSIADSMKCLLQHIDVKDCLVFCHWEEFVRYVTNEKSFKKQFKERIVYCCNKLNAIATYPTLYGAKVTSNNKTILEKLRVMGRRAFDFEFPMPTSPSEFCKEARNQDKLYQYGALTPEEIWDEDFPGLFS
ncbi:MAG: hypothetical protein GY854_26590 [Deltaproteobacteria bacterium]|nr:hypothetical protein [Deltaproteobacteria bacterium]